MLCSAVNEIVVLSSAPLPSPCVYEASTEGDVIHCEYHCENNLQDHLFFYTRYTRHTWDNGQLFYTENRIQLLWNTFVT